MRLDRSGAGLLAGAPQYGGAVFAPLPMLRTLRVVVDRGSVEIFANGGAICVTEMLAWAPIWRKAAISAPDEPVRVKVAKCFCATIQDIVFERKIKR